MDVFLQGLHNTDTSILQKLDLEFINYGSFYHTIYYYRHQSGKDTQLCSLGIRLKEIRLY